MRFSSVTSWALPSYNGSGGSNGESSGLSTGARIGIGVGVGIGGLGLIIGGALFALRYRRRVATKRKGAGEQGFGGEEVTDGARAGPYVAEKGGQNFAQGLQPSVVLPSEPYHIQKTGTMSELESPLENRVELEAAREATIKREMSLRELP